MADTEQIISKEDIPTEKGVESVSENDSTAEINESKNLKQIKCQRCPSAILVSGITALHNNEADTKQNIPEEDLSTEKVVKSVSENDCAAEVNEEGKNLKQIKCQRCPSTILVSGTATLVTNEFVLPDSQLKEAKPDSTNHINKYWCVENMYAFENVGFSKAVDGIKYLICADCEIGPIDIFGSKFNALKLQFSMLQFTTLLPRSVIRQTKWQCK